MQTLPQDPMRTIEDVARYESEMPLEQRLPGRSVFDVFTATAQRHPTTTARTMVMPGADDEQPRRSSPW
jgi:fatty-acyl-CoA synthase